jgi:hypothetical protein
MTHDELDVLKQALTEHLKVNAIVTDIYFKADDLGGLVKFNIEVTTNLEWDGEVIVTNVGRSKFNRFGSNEYLTAMWRGIHGLDRVKIE